MKDQIAGCGDSMARAGANFMEGMKFGGTWRAKEAVPGIGTEAQDARESALKGAKTDGAKKRGEIGTERKDPGTISSPGLILTTRKIAVFVSGAETGCETATADDALELMKSDAIGILAAGLGRRLPLEKSSAQRVISGKHSLAKVGE
jgi:hypothetical protein